MLYRWNRSTIIDVDTTENTGQGSIALTGWSPNNRTVYYANSNNFTIVNKQYVFNDTEWQYLIGDGTVTFSANTYTMYSTQSQSNPPTSDSFYSSNRQTTINKPEGDNGPFYLSGTGTALILHTIGDGKGSFIDYVYDINKNQYPTNGIQGDYWYKNKINTFMLIIDLFFNY